MYLYSSVDFHSAVKFTMCIQSHYDFTIPKITTLIPISSDLTQNNVVIIVEMQTTFAEINTQLGFQIPKHFVNLAKLVELLDLIMT